MIEIESVLCFRRVVFLRGRGAPESVSVSVVEPAPVWCSVAVARDGAFEAIALMRDYQEACAAAIGVWMIDGERVENPGGLAASRLRDSDNGPLAHFLDAVRIRKDHPRLLEIGSRARSGISRREWFSNCDYLGFDIMEGPNVDVVGDAHELSSLGLGAFDYVFSIAVFEHLLMPWKVAVEISRVLKSGGLLLVHSHQSWPVHDQPWDFFRFSRESWAALFNAATGFEMVLADHFEPVLMVRANESGNYATHFGEGRGFGGSACLARKIGDARVQWNVRLGEVVETSYPTA